jgi:type IV pilus assembly protein PilQ
MHTLMTNSSFRVLFTAGWLILAASGASIAGAADNTGQAAEAQASNSVENLDYATMPGGKVVVKVTLKEELKQPPASFMTKSPSRVVLDFPNTSSHLAKNSVAVSNASLRSMNVAQASGRTRLVLNLDKAVSYSTLVEGKTIVISLQETGTAPSKENVVTHFTQPKLTGQQGALTGVDFQRGKNGEGRIIADFGDPGTGIDIRQQGKNLVIDFLNTAVPGKLERRLNVTDFATPVLTVDTFKQGNNTRMVIEPKGEWEHAAYQTDNRFVVEIKPIVFDPTKAVQGSKEGFGGEKLSLDFNAIDVRSLLRIIGDFTGKNVVVSDAVSGTLSLHLKDVPWDQALDIIMKQKGLGMDNAGGNTLVFAPKEEINARRKTDQEQENQIDDIKPLLTQSFEIKYQKAADIKALISDAKQPLLSKRGSSMIDSRTNILFVKDIDTSLAKIQEILNKIDVPARQVLIESRIVNANQNFSRSLGAKFGVTKKSGAGGTGIATSAKVANSQNLATGTSTVSGTQDLNVNMPATGAAVASLALTLFKLPAGFLLNLELSAAEADGITKVISSPRVITANGNQATFSVGEQIPYQEASSSGASTTAFKDATISITVTPQITPDDKINMDIAVTNDSRGDSVNNIPLINKNTVNTKLLVDNGETAVLGGFFKETKSDNNQRVPFFGNLPIIGFAFRQNATEDKKQEILFFITPKIASDSLLMK